MLSNPITIDLGHSRSREVSITWQFFLQRSWLLYIGVWWYVPIFFSPSIHPSLSLPYLLFMTACNPTPPYTMPTSSCITLHHLIYTILHHHSDAWRCGDGAHSISLCVTPRATTHHYAHSVSQHKSLRTTQRHSASPLRITTHHSRHSASSRIISHHFASFASFASVTSLHYSPSHSMSLLLASFLAGSLPIYHNATPNMWYPRKEAYICFSNRHKKFWWYRNVEKRVFSTVTYSLPPPPFWPLFVPLVFCTSDFGLRRHVTQVRVSVPLS